MADDSAALKQLTKDIKLWGKALGFQQVGIADIHLHSHGEKLKIWLDKQYHGDMNYMEAHGNKRYTPDALVPETLRVISVRMDYLPPDASFAKSLKNKNNGYISRYAVGRDYHKLMRNRLKQLGQKIKAHWPNCSYRPFVDSAPVLERPLAEKAGLGWVGKHSLVLNEHAGSWFFLGELFVNLPLPTDTAVEEKCGQCVACMTICPTQAIVEPYVVDARRCISYLTIELKDAIPIEFREAIGNRIYGCDDCQLVCPWNRYAQLTKENDFFFRKQLRDKSLTELFIWTEEEFLELTQGSAIRRIGHERWRRNIAVAMGNSQYCQELIGFIEEVVEQQTPMVREHLLWALESLNKKITSSVRNRSLERLIRVVEKGLPRDS